MPLIQQEHHPVSSPRLCASVVRFLFGVVAGSVGMLGMLGLVALITGAPPTLLSMTGAALLLWSLVDWACHNPEVGHTRTEVLGSIGPGEYAQPIIGRCNQKPQ